MSKVREISFADAKTGFLILRTKLKVFGQDMIGMAKRLEVIERELIPKDKHGRHKKGRGKAKTR